MTNTTGTGTVETTDTRSVADKPDGGETVDTALDYDKLIEFFGCSKFDDVLLQRLEKVAGKPVHHLFRRAIFHSHRELDAILKLKEDDKPFYLCICHEPSALHLGHLVLFTVTKWLQDVFDVPLIIQLADDAAAAWNQLTIEQATKLARENAKDIIAFGFDVNKTFIFSNLSGGCEAFYRNSIRVQMNILLDDVKKVFPLIDTDNIGKINSAGTQVVPCLSSTFPFLFGDAKVPCLVPCSIDQDPYFRLAGVVADTLGHPKLALLHSTFLPALQGTKIKISASDSNSSVFLTDTQKEIKTKINKHAFSGGQVTLEEHRAKGGNTDIDLSYHLLKFFLANDDELERIRVAYGKGEILSGEIKKLAIETLQPIVAEHQQKRKAVTEAIIDSFLAERSFKL